MPTDVVMPQMGESITEGTITKWLKKVGDKVERDEPLFEISTDKVDAGDPFARGRNADRDQISRGRDRRRPTTVVAVIGGGGGEPAAAPALAELAPAPGDSRASRAGSRGPSSRRQLQSCQQPQASVRAFLAAGCARLPRHNNVDLNRVSGTGPSGRITKTDILGYIENPAAKPGAAAARPKSSAAAPAADAPIPGSLVPMTKIAQHHRAPAWSNPSRPAHTSTPSSRWT